MPALANMEILTHEIAQSHRDRVAGIDRLKVTVESMLKDLDRAHRTMSVSLNSVLTEGRNALRTPERTRKAMSRALHAGLFRTKTDRAADVRAMLTGINGAHLDMAQVLRHSLARNAADCRASARGTVRDLGAGRQTMGKSLHLELNRRGAARQGLGKSLHMDLSRENTSRKAAVRGMLAALDRSQRGMSKDLHASLAHSEASLRATTAALLKDFQNQQAELRTELTAVQVEWQGLVATMDAARRGSKSAAVATPVTEASPPVPTAASVAEGTHEETPELDALRGRAFEYLADHPDGSRLVEMETEMRASRFQMSRVLRSLMDENKVEKRDMLYFAI